MRAPHDTASSGLLHLALSRPGWGPLLRLGHRDPGAMSDRQLSHRWRVTYDGVGASRATRKRLAPAQERQALLDELERRHPDASRAVLRLDWRSIDDW